MTAALVDGFCFAAKASDEVTNYVVNVCGHESVGKPLSRSMDEVDEKYLDEFGVDNLVIPISVGVPQKIEKEGVDYVVDVVMHPWITERCRKPSRLLNHFVARIIALSLDWIKTECGVTLVEKTCRFIGTQYFGSKTKKANEQSVKEAMEMFDKFLKEVKKDQPETEAPIPSDLKVSANRNEKPNKPLVQELPQTTTGIKKGFLNGKQSLYGPEGSKEGDGPKYDPLGHIPESLRNKCKIIDTTKLGEPSNVSVAQKSAPQKASPPPPPPQVEKVLPPPKEEKSKQDWILQSLTVESKIIVVEFCLAEHVAEKPPVDLEATEHTLELNDLVTDLPLPIDSDEVTAKFVKKQGSSL
ncbi:hypothetical protein AGDE_08258 [Angomonas deanei]|nr:hypothetical protein AGDE_08258 [Angomonas deanei]|eukprot:EPY33489.1 hypothetical protein AGDE_08258 [Angomonas deanei]